jgi:hypothetical protein
MEPAEDEEESMMRSALFILLLGVPLAACNSDSVLVPVGGVPAAPRALAASYYAGAVTVEWELAPAWDGEAFRVYSRRVTDSDYFLVAEVTSCSEGLCSYQDVNVTAGETYEYYVAAVDPTTGTETSTASTVEVFVPTPTPPPVPDGPFVIALDGANFVTWGTASRGAGDFSHYRVYQDAGTTSYLLGETDSEGFLDLLAVNGETYAYVVTSVDTDGHESGGSLSAEGTPRPDFHGEILFAHSSDPSRSGFRFSGDGDNETAIVSGTDASRDFRLETDVAGWWLVPNTGVQATAGYVTTALKCGVAADPSCVDVSVAPTSNASYLVGDVPLFPQETYVVRIGTGSAALYGAFRVVFQGQDQDANEIMIVDWAFQLQAANPNLAPAVGG